VLQQQSTTRPSSVLHQQAGSTIPLCMNVLCVHFTLVYATFTVGVRNIYGLFLCTQGFVLGHLPRLAALPVCLLRHPSTQHPDHVTLCAGPTWKSLST
jgi:hypothetical protein